MLHNLTNQFLRCDRPKTSETDSILSTRYLLIQLQMDRKTIRNCSINTYGIKMMLQIHT